MKKYILSGIYLLITLMQTQAADWQPKDIDGLVRISFPGVSQMSDVRNIRNYTYTTDSCTYQVQVTAMDRGELVSDTARLSVFYDGIVKGVLKGFKGSLISTKHVTILGQPGEEFEYVKGDTKHQPVSVITRILILNGHMIVYSFSAPYSHFSALHAYRDSFFTSISFDRSKSFTKSAEGTSITPGLPVTPRDSNPPQPPVAIHAELIRPNTLHFIVSFVLAILLLSGSLYIIVRMRKKKEKA